ncbi:DUF3364 domain-containing protein [Vibrio sp. M60_M31a]
MTQNIEEIKAGYSLFQEPEYQELLANKRSHFEEAVEANKVKEVFEWTTTKEYQELNFNRKHITIDPAKACQPLVLYCVHLALKKRCLMSTVHKAAWRILERILTDILKNLLPVCLTR